MFIGDVKFDDVNKSISDMIGGSEEKETTFNDPKSNNPCGLTKAACPSFNFNFNFIFTK